jgi:DNA-binding NtrC family response regulator
LPAHLEVERGNFRSAGGLKDNMAKQLKILLIEDDTDTRELLAEILGESFKMLTAPDAEQGLKVFLKDRPDLVVSDETLPGKSGIALARQIKEQSPKTPFVLVSGHAEIAGSEICEKVLGKPVDLDKLRAAIESLCGKLF